MKLTAAHTRVRIRLLIFAIMVSPLRRLDSKVAKGRTIRKVMGGMGDFLPARIFFLAHFQCKNFFLATALCMNFFFLRKCFPYAQFAIELIKNNATLFY